MVYFIIIVLFLLIPYCLLGLYPSLSFVTWHINYYIVIISLSLQVIIFKKEGFFSHANLICYLFHFQWLSGLANYSICNAILPYYFLDVEHIIMIWLIFIVFYQLGVLYFSYCSPKITSAESPRPKFSLNPKILLRFSIVYFILFCVGTAISLKYFGTLPLLMGDNLDVMRFQWQKDLGSFITGRLVYSSLPMAFLLISWFFLYRKIAKAVLFFFAFIPISILFGDRVLSVFLLIYLLSYFNKYKINLLKSKNMILISLSVIILISIFSVVGYVRGSLYGGEAHKLENFWEIGMLNYGTGIRDAARFLESGGTGRVEIKDFLMQFLLIIPSSILKISQLNPDVILDNSLPNVAANALGHYSGIRFGIIGELFFSFGYPAIVLMFFMGIIVTKLEDYWRNGLNPEDPLFIVLSSVMAIVVFLPEEGPAIFISYLKLVGLATLPLLLFRRSVARPPL